MNISTEKEVTTNLMINVKNAITETLIKEGYLWERHLEEKDDKVKNQIKMQYASEKRKREDDYEPFLKYLEKCLKELSD